MKSLKITVVLMVLMTWFTSNVLAQQSDYVIKNEFVASIEALYQETNNAHSLFEIKSINSKVDSLENKYNEHRKMLDNALYPQNFDQYIGEIKDHILNTKTHLRIVQNQVSLIRDLNYQIERFENEVARLNNHTDRLLNDLGNLKNQNNEYEDLISEYQDQTAKRDQFIIDFMENLYNSYEGVKFQISDDHRSSEKVFGQANDPYALVLTIIENNISDLKIDQDLMQTEDYFRNYIVQNKFESIWDRTEMLLRDLYEVNDETYILIDEKLDEWKDLTSQKMWSSIQRYLNANQILLEDFSDSESFYQSLDSFVNQEMENSGIIYESDELNAFYVFWNDKIKNEWGGYVKEADVLKAGHISAIDNSLRIGFDKDSNKAYLMPTLFGVSLLTIIILLTVIVRNPVRKY